MEFNYCGQQFSGKSQSTSKYVASRKDQIDASLGEPANGALFFTFYFIYLEYKSTFPLGPFLL